MRERVRAFDWSGTALGPIDRWPFHLRLALGICLDSGFPIALYLGPELVLVYNDAWSSIPGDRHPWALGQPAREVWPEIWEAIEPSFRQVMATGEAIVAKDAYFSLQRHGYTEECYFDYTLGALRGPGGTVDGIFNAAIERTYRVLGERRMRLLRELAQRTAAARTVEETCAEVCATLAGAAEDVPFALTYLLRGDGREAELAGSTRLERETPASPCRVDLGGEGADPWSLAAVARTGEPQLISDLPGRFGPLPGGAWPEPAGQALVLPIAAAGLDRLAGFLVAGVSPRRVLDDEYRAFFELAAGQVATAFANARAYQHERQRAEALAELDRAKSAFFSNVSHELRTPLTLILGPLEDLLGEAGDRLPPKAQELLEVVRRNSLRLMRLVNTLLDFSRIEAGHARASFQPTDLALVTRGLAGSFDSACKRANLQLVVDCPPLPAPVYVDREMWERIVLNLISNAFKFTLEGEIEVRLRASQHGCELAVRDTGIGIAELDQAHLFERFHRVAVTKARSFGGTGIGLSLVKELTRLHGGTVRAESVLGQGSTFFVNLPFGAAHLPSEQVVAGPERPDLPGRHPYLEETLEWLTLEREGGPREPEEPQVERPLVLVADDNADLREYLRRLLAGSFEVEAVADGRWALAAASRRRPALVLADVMMPGLDGFALLRALRADPGLRTVPVILLSARAGEESRVEGLEAGADDYLPKPFSSRELLARVSATLELARLREVVEREAGRAEGLREREAALQRLNEELELRVQMRTEELEQASLAKDHFLATMSHELRTPLNAVIGFTGTLLMRLPGPLTQDQEKQLSIVQSSARHLLSLINDLLDLTKIESGKVELQLEAVPLREVVAEVITSLRPLARAKGLLLGSEIPEESLLVRADRRALSQILLNLAGNGIKFTEEGEVRIAATAGAEGGRSVVALSVIDTGVGIRPEDQARLFQPFTQLGDTTQHRAGGTGLGLHLSQRLATLLGGEVRCQSEPGRGSTFTLVLDRADSS